VDHHLDRSGFHHRWELDTEPTLAIASGDVVEFDLEMAGAGKIREGDRHEDTTFDFDTVYRLLGPVLVTGARPGDTLRVEALSMAAGEWGWCGTESSLGLLPDDFPKPFVKTFDLRNGRNVEVCQQVTVPLAPFLGTMGTQPDAPPSAPSFPPHKGGGNIDTRHLTAGSTLWRPVWCDGALFSCGDPHGAQGDGVSRCR
jgi:acetamidase/formamidase